MNWLAELNVGDNVYIVPSSRFSNNYPAKVIKKGRKLVTLARIIDGNPSNLTVVAEMSSRWVVTRVTCGVGDNIYRSEAHYQQTVWLSNLRYKVSDHIRFKDVSDEQIKQIASVLGIECEAGK